MPAQSIKQRRLMAIAEHSPEQVYAKNRGVLKMGKQQLHDFATTSEKNLPTRVSRHDDYEQHEKMVSRAMRTGECGK